MNDIFKIFIVLLFCAYSILPAKAENIHFDNKIYDLKYSDISKLNNCIENEYFLSGESKDLWTSLIGIYYYPDVKNPLKYARDIDEKVESDNKCVLLKLVQNKKQDIAVISYLENVENNGRHFFIYNIYKYEKHPKTSGMMVLRYAKRYNFLTDEDIKNIGLEIRKINNDYMEKIIASPIPPVSGKILEK